MLIYGVILAGGSGLRMGGADKALMPLGGRPLLAHAMERLAPQVAQLVISANGDATRFAAFGLPVLPDAQVMGPLGGILAALDWATGADAVVSVAVDTPFFPCDLVPRLCLAADGIGMAMAQSGGHDHPTFALWPTALRGALRAFLNSGAKPRVRDFAQAHNVQRAVFVDDSAFHNLNTSADLAQAAGLLT
jgi:molybdenum cofactor guanylyltransferase